jgi:flavodoxin
MKMLLAYYTRSGTNEKIVNELQGKLNCDIEKIIDTVNREGAWGFFISGIQATFKRKSKIKPIEKDPSSYDLVIIVSPIWAGVMPPPVRTYISENKDSFKKIALLSVSGGGMKNKKAISDLESLACKKAVATLLLTEDQFKQESYREKLEDFVEFILSH